jgi:hypothetical protein
MDYIKATWPFFNRTGGADHFVWLPGDFGACEISEQVRGLYYYYMEAGEKEGLPGASAGGAAGAAGWKRLGISCQPILAGLVLLLGIADLLLSDQLASGQPSAHLLGMKRPNPRTGGALSPGVNLQDPDLANMIKISHWGWYRAEPAVEPFHRMAKVAQTSQRATACSNVTLHLNLPCCAGATPMGRCARAYA